MRAASLAGLVPRLSLLLLLLCSALTAQAGAPPSVGKAMARRAEASQQVELILSGGSVNAAVSRVQFLGEEEFASRALVDAMTRVSDLRVRRGVVEALVGLRRPVAEPVLLEALGEKDPGTRVLAAQGAGRIGARAAIPTLEALLADPAVGVRREAAHALGVLASTRSGKLLLKAAREEAEPEARAAMLVAAGLSGDGAVAKGLEAFLGNSSESARLAAAQGLCVMGAKAGTDFAAKLLASDDRFERLAGLKLYEGGKAKAISRVLLPLLEGQDLKVGAVAARMLVEGGDATKVDWLVIKSHLARADDKLLYETELESLRLTDAQRSAILKKAKLQ